MLSLSSEASRRSPMRSSACERGVEVEVVSPLSFRHFGIAYGHGVLGNLRRRPWLALLLPAMLGSFVRARRAAHGADLVHAHWLAAGWVAHHQPAR